MSAEPAILFTEQLHDDQKKQLLALETACRRHDGSLLSYPAEDPDTIHWLLYINEASPNGGRPRDGGQSAVLAAALALSFCGDELAECVAFTLPAYRQKGYFSRLLSLAEQQAEELDILFPVSNRCADALAVLDGLGAEFESEELQMELDLGTWNPTEKPLSASFPSLTLSSSQPETEQKKEEAVSSFTLLSAEALPLGSCQLTPAGSSAVCLHHVEILPPFRGRGLSRVMLSLLLEALKDTGVRRVLLQVSAANAPALALYKKTGFRVTQSLSFYLY